MKDNLEHRFKQLEGQFDIEEPAIGHFDRFEAKLASQDAKVKRIQWNPNTWKWLSVAASVLLLVGFWFGSYSAKSGMELADLSPEMEETQSFFVTTIQQEVEKINLQRNSDTEQIITDAFIQLEKLEANYEELKVELLEISEDKRIIFAMINNYQQRINVLQNLLEQIEEINYLNDQDNTI